MPGHRGMAEPEDADDSSSTDLSLGQATTGGGGGKARLDSLRENLFKQQERLTALRERALRKSEDGAAPRKSSLSDSMESLKSLGQKLTKLKGSPGQQQLMSGLAAQDASTPLVTPTKATDQLEYSGSEKLQMLNQRTEQNRALLEQRKRDMAKSLQSVKTGLRQSTSSELGSSMSDLRAATAAAPVSRHRSAADLQQQQAAQAQAQPASEEGRLKLLKNKMKLIEMKQGRKEQELQQELHELRNELAQREQHIQQLEASERPLAEQENTRLHAEIEQLRARNAELEHSSEMLDTLRLELHSAREQLLEQQQQQSQASVSTDAQVNVELAKQLQELQQQLLELRSSSSSHEEQLQHEQEPRQAGGESQRLAELEATIDAQNEQLAEKTTELNVLNVNLRVLEERLAQSVKSKPLFLDEEPASEQLQQQLKQKLDECNKSNIKLKLKCKQAEKQLQQLQSQDAQQELLRLTAENEQLQQRITVLEDEKGQWQLAHVEEEQLEQEQLASKPTPTAGQSETIRLLEEQKEELQQALAALQMGSAAARVESELSEVQLEEQLSQRVQQLEAEANEQRQQLQTLQSEKEALDKKLSHYINENMELLDKLEKLSSSSSAESIEIVERPTDRRFSQRPASATDPAAVGDGAGAGPGAGAGAETGAGQQAAAAPARLPSFVSELTQTDLVAAPELEVNESLAQLRNESDELLQKIELFTSERREVLAKMEQLQAQNAQLQAQLQAAQEQQQATQEQQQATQEQLQADRAQLKAAQEQLQAENGSLQAQLEELQRDKQQLSLQLSEKSNLSQELSSMQRSSEVVAALDCGADGAALFDKCERSLSKLSSELEAYRKANDRNAKLNVSKKLAKEAKNVHSQLSELLHKVKEASTAVETVTVVETVVAVTAPNGKALAEYEQLNAQNAELKAALAALRAELAELRDSCEPPELSKRAIGHKLDEEWVWEKEQELEREQEREKEKEQEREKEKEREREQEQERESLIAELQQQLAQLQSIIAELRAGETEHLQLIASQSAELVQLQLQAEQFDQSLNKSEMAHEKHMEQQQRLRRELQSRIETLEGEQSILQALVAEQKQQLIESYSESEYETNMKLLELQQCQQELEQSETRNKELREKLKKYAVNLKKRQVEHTELQDQLQREQASTTELREQVQRLQSELEQAQQQAQLDSKELQQQLLKQQSKLAKLKEEVERLQVELQNTVHANTALRQESYQLELSLAEQTSNEELRRQLEQKSLKFDKSKEVIKQRNAAIQSLQRELAELRAQLQAQPEEEEEKEEQLQQSLHLYQLQVQQLQAQNDQLTEDKLNFEVAYNQLETLHIGIELKLQQDRSYIETLEAQNADLQSKCAALEDQAAVLQAHELSAKEQLQQLQQQLHQVETERAEHETLLGARLQQLAQREQSQDQQLKLLGSEAQEAREQMLALQSAHDTLLARHKQHTQQAQQAQAEREQLTSNSEQELQELRSQLETRNQELQRQRQVYDAKLAAKASELDELECDLSAHMERANAQTRELTQQLERAQEQLQQRDEELARLNVELGELERERLLEQQELQKVQQLRLQSNQELRALQQQIAELGTQNQTDDQVHIETETNRLVEKLAELDEQTEQLARHQPASAPTLATADDWMAWSRPDPGPGLGPMPLTEQNVPLPAPAMFFGGDAAAAPSPFDEIVAQPLRMGTQNLGVPQAESSEASIEELQRNVSDLEKRAKELETQLLACNQALAEHEERRVQLERVLAEREQELAQLRAAAEERERLAAIEQLIQPTANAAVAPTLDMFFGGETVPDAAVARSQQELGLPQSEPVVEQLITPKKAYLCQPEQEQQQEEQQPANDWAVDVDEDPWANAGAEQQLTDATAALHARIEELEAQKAKLQTKTAKLMKCVKEYRNKEQQEQARKDNNNDDLDGAIIDELKLQLQLQETRQAKTEELLQQQALEKEKLAKRIDVLTAGNERMAELKERQDREVQMYQTRIRELQEKLQQLESWDEVAATPTVPPSGEDAAAGAARATIENLQAENQELNSECQELLAQLQHEKQRAQREREQLQAQLEAHGQQAEQVKQQAEQQVKQQVEQVKQQVEQVKQQAEQQVEQQLEQLTQQAELEKQQAEQEKHQVELEKHQVELEKQQAELEKQQAEQECQQLQLQLAELRAKQLELPAMVTAPPATAPSDESRALLQEKESEIVHLKQRIEELMREDQTEKLVLEILTKNQELQLLRMQVKQLEEDKLEQQQQVNQPSQAAEPVEELEQLRRQCEQQQQEKSDMEEELRVLNNHVLSSLELEDKMKQAVLELDTKTIEITELRKTLEQLQHQQGQQQVPPQPDIGALNKQWEALVEQKCSEVASIWQEHLAQREADYQAKIEQLTATTSPPETAEQQTPVPATAPVDATTDVGEMLLKMQRALETQEMEIVTLKEQLAIRSAEYARLASQYDPFRLQNTLGGGNPSGPSGSGSEPQQSGEYVPKSDLDYALMMLHQRDMRVEEMIVELVQLLEERDHLQLKLSDTLRQLEAERTGAPFSNSPAAASTTTATALGSPHQLSVSSSSSGGDLAVSPAASGSDLKQKLAELQTVKHSKDKAIVDEREQRLQQMVQLQRDMARAAPSAGAAAAAGTAPALPTPTPPAQLQQQQQLDVDPTQPALRSPSMLLMDWILGNNKSDDEPTHSPSQPLPPQQQQQPSHPPTSN